MYAIFTKHKTKRGLSESILLTDGAFISAQHEFPDKETPWLKPKLFATKGGAKNYRHKYFNDNARYTIREYK